MPITHTFDPPVDPDPGYRRGNKPRVLEADFGDGYSQRAVDGINLNRREIDLKWTNLYKEEKEYIDGFLKDRKGQEAFFYQFPDETAPRAYTCKEWDDEHVAFEVYSMTAKFRQVYDI
jgi:phage-related protein